MSLHFVKSTFWADDSDNDNSVYKEAYLGILEMAAQASTSSQLSNPPWTPRRWLARRLCGPLDPSGLL